LCNIDPACLLAPLLQFSFPLTVAPFLHDQSGLTMSCNRLAVPVPQHGVVEVGCLVGGIRAGGYWLIFVIAIVIVIIVVSDGLVLVVVSGMWLHTVRSRRI